MLGSAHGLFGGVSGSAEGNARVFSLRVRPVSIFAALALAATLGAAACGGQATGTVLSAVTCSIPQVAAGSSATATAAAKSLGIAAPVWSGAVGRPSVIVGDTAYGTGPDGRCTTAF